MSVTPRSLGGISAWPAQRCRIPQDGYVRIVSRRRTHSVDGVGVPVSRVEPNVLPDRRLREGVEADPSQFAKGLQRRELFLAENRDDAKHSRPPRSPEMRSGEMNVCRSIRLMS